MDDKEREIQRLQNQVNALGHSLIRALGIIDDMSRGATPQKRIDAEITALKSLLRTR